MQKKFWLLISLLSISGFAQTENTQKIDEVLISSFHVNDSLLNAPASVGILTKKELTANDNSNIAVAMNRLAGVYMQSSNLATTRISIRGIGARTPYGTNKIRAFYGSIPLTSGNGETVIDDIDLENIGQIEVIRGPLSSIYGAGLGGAILINPEKTNSNSASISTTHGSFGLLKNTVSAGINTQKSNFNVSYHNLKTDGWRQNSSYKREGVTLSGELFKTENSRLHFLGNFTDLKVFIPSSIDRATFENNPRAAAGNWLASRGYKDYRSVLGGLGYTFKISNSIENATSIFANYKDNYEPRPFDILSQYTFSYGVRSQFTGEILKKIDWNAGIEFFQDDYSGRNFQNLYQQNDGQGSLQGNLLANQEQDRQFLNAFAQVKIPIVEKLDFQAGLNYNHTKFSLQGIFPEESPQQNYNYDGILAPQFSLLYEPFQMAKIYASASRGFSLPSVDETLTEDGTINPNIKPENGYNFEVGGKFYFFGRKLYTEISVFQMNINDLLVARRVGDDQYVGINAGETSHKGIEFSANGFFMISKNISLLPFASFSLGNFKFEDFVDRENNFSGNKLTGVPANKANAGITFQLNSGLYFSVDYQYLDEIPLNDANTDFADPYQLFNAKAGYGFAISKNLKTSLSAGINNIFNEKYAALVLPNAVGNANSSPRFFYPGLPVNFYGNFSVAYTL